MKSDRNRTSGTTPAEPGEPAVLATGARVGAATFAGVQFADGIACAIPAKFIVDALDNVDCPTEVRRVLPIIKIASAAGLAAGIRCPKLGKITAAGLIGYFIAAIGFHIKAKDTPANAAPAVAMLAASAAMYAGFRTTK